MKLIILNDLLLLIGERIIQYPLCFLKFEQNWVPLTQKYFVANVVKIDTAIL